MSDLGREGALPAGLYLVGARPGAADVPFGELAGSVRHLALAAGSAS
jgi:hypothetical protein